MVSYRWYHTDFVYITGVFGGGGGQRTETVERRLQRSVSNEGVNRRQQAAPTPPVGPTTPALFDDIEATANPAPNGPPGGVVRSLYGTSPSLVICIEPGRII